MIKVVCAVIVFNRKILITQNCLQHNFSLLWEFPGGKIEVDETNFEAIKREIKEELSMEVSPLFAFTAMEFIVNGVAISLQPIVCKCHSAILSLNVHNDARWVVLEDFENYHLAPTDKTLIEIYEKSLAAYIYQGV